jgi:FtsZ-binding cell division protein ZapB
LYSPLPLFVGDKMDNGFLDNYVLPDGAAEAIKKAGINGRKLGEGIEIAQFGHDGGVAYRFFVHQEKNEAKSKIAKVPISDAIEMIEWMPDRFQHPTEQLRFLPYELLAFDEDGECIGGKYREAYLSWKKGLNAPGLTLTRWGELSDSDIFTLHELRIYSVEQFAAQPRSKIDRLPTELREKFEDAVRWVNGKENRALTAEHATQVLNVQQENAKLRDEVAAMQEQMKALMGGHKAPKRKRGPRGPNKPKAEPTDGN